MYRSNTRTLAITLTAATSLLVAGFIIQPTDSTTIDQPIGNKIAGSTESIEQPRGYFVDEELHSSATGNQKRTGYYVDEELHSSVTKREKPSGYFVDEELHS